jgi:hypothetical protein
MLALSIVVAFATTGRLTVGDKENSVGRGKNETNIVCVRSQVTGFGCASLSWAGGIDAGAILTELQA